MEPVILDVREHDEFEAIHIPCSVWAPLSQFGHAAPGIVKFLEGREVLLMCRSGGRAEFALEHLERMGLGGRVKAKVFPGGIIEWERQGKPVERGSASSIPLVRQVHLVAGILVLSSALSGLLWDPRILWLTVFVGAGLAFSGLTGFCGLAKLLALMPWNRKGCAPPGGPV